jgi:hypothetical protein
VLEQGHPIANVKMCTRKLHSPLTAGERLPPGVCDRQPHQAERPTARLHGLRIRRRKSVGCLGAWEYSCKLRED